MALDDLTEFGMVEMTDDEVRGFLTSQRAGVLGLPTGGAPSLRPMSYAYDGDRALYMLYVLGSGARKADLSDVADVARFLVYSAESPFNWQSVLLTGDVTAVPEDERASVAETVELTWRPEVFERASTAATTRLYRFHVDEWSGIKHTGLPPGFDAE